MKAQVTLKHCDTYSRGIVYQKIRDALSKLGGMSRFVSRGQRVLIKPNVLLGKEPGNVVTTHPTVLWAVIKMVQEEGGIVFVGDSPGFGNGRKAAKQSGLLEVVDECGAKWIDFSDPVTIPGLPNGIFKSFTVDKHLPVMDVIINLPKLKTHFRMLVTMAVKNLYGCLIGPQKTHWKLQCNHNILYFSKMLVELSEVLHPQLTIVDAIVGMEGTGPVKGSPRSFNLIAAGTNPTAVDRILAEVLMINPDLIPTLNAAKRINTGVWDLNEIDLGDRTIKNYLVKDLIHPESNASAMNSVQKAVYRLLKKPLTRTLVIDSNKCSGCKACYDNCPIGAITATVTGSSDTAPYSIDHHKCIGCTYCQEICPEGAIRPVQSWLSSLLHDKLAHISFF